jgi:HPt (histidine-containing phosphotransfer) domain-containing protein
VGTELLMDTGRRPEEIRELPLDCLAQDPDGSPVLVYDNFKSYRLGRRLPIGKATAAVITGQQERVRTLVPHTPVSELKLMPATKKNPRGTKAIYSISEGHRSWVDSLPDFLVPIIVEEEGGEPVTRLMPFDKTRIFPYAYRHTYAQRHADADVAPDVLEELMDHTDLKVTQNDYRVSQERRREAVDRVVALQFDRHGNRVWRKAQSLMDSEHVRRAIGEVSVPYGVCQEPSNVAAGGQSCPIRLRCVGCDHFRTDVSYLPDLQAYLADLLRSRERLMSAFEADDWARSEAMPSDEEIRRVRRLIARVKADLGNLSVEEQAQIEEAVAVIRRGRTVLLGMGAYRPAPARRPPQEAGMSTMHQGRQDGTDRRRQRVTNALKAAARNGSPISVSGIARQAGVDRTFLYRTRDLLALVHAAGLEPADQDPAGATPVSRASLQADLGNAQARNTRLVTRIQQLEKRLSEALGEQVWRESGLGAPADIDELQHKITRLEQHNVDLAASLEEREAELAAAREANRQLTRALNQRE